MEREVRGCDYLVKGNLVKSSSKGLVDRDLLVKEARLVMEEFDRQMEEYDKSDLDEIEGGFSSSSSLCLDSLTGVSQLSSQV